MNNKLKSFCMTFAIFLVVVAIVTSVPFSYLSIDNSHLNENQEQISPVGEAEGVAPLVVGGAGVAGLAAGAGGSAAIYKYTDYFSDDSLDSADYDAMIDAGDELQEDTLRETVHADAFISEGSSQDFLENYDNDLAFVESNVEDVVNREFMQILEEKADDLDEEGRLYLADVMDITEAQNIGEVETSEYLNESMQNIVETHNYQAYSVKNYVNRLDAAGYSDDIGAVEVVDVDDTDDMLDVAERLVEEENNLYININEDIELDEDEIESVSSSLALYSPDDGLDDGITHTFDLNDNTLEFNGEDFIYLADDEPATNHIFLNGVIKTDSQIGDIRGSEYTINLIDVDTSDIDTIASGVTGASGSSNVYDSEVDDTEDINDISSLEDITFDPDTVVDESSEYSDVSDVSSNTIELEQNEDVDMTAEQIDLGADYSGDSVNFVVPYNLDSESYVDFENQDVLLQTTTSGLDDFAEPHAFGDYYTLVNNRNDRSEEAFSMSQEYVTEFYEANENEDLNEFMDSFVPLSDSVSYADMDSREAFANTYVSRYDGTVNPHSEGMIVSDSEDVEYSGALFTSDIATLVTQTPDEDVFEIGDEFAVTEDDYVKMVDDRGTEQILEADTYTVDSMEGTYESIDIRNHDYESNDLNDIIDRQNSQEQVVQDTLDDDIGGVDLPGDDSIIYVILLILIVGLLIARSTNNSGGNNGYSAGYVQGSQSNNSNNSDDE